MSQPATLPDRLNAVIRRWVGVPHGGEHRSRRSPLVPSYLRRPAVSRADLLSEGRIHGEVNDRVAGGGLSALREAPEQFAEEMRFAAAVHWYHQGRISGSKAAQVAGMTRLEFLDELARRKLDVVKVDIEQLRRELTRA